MTDALMVIPVGSEVLVFTSSEVEQARQRGRQQGFTQPGPEPQESTQDQILDAEGMEKATGIPRSWFLERARCGELEHIRAGKYVRFSLRKTLTALSTGEIRRKDY